MNKITSTIVIRKANTIYLECLFGDGSIWLCDTDGTNWEQLSPSYQELANKFNERNVPKV